MRNYICCYQSKSYEPQFFVFSFNSFDKPNKNFIIGRERIRLEESKKESESLLKKALKKLEESENTNSSPLESLFRIIEEEFDTKVVYKKGESSEKIVLSSHEKLKRNRKMPKNRDDYFNVSKLQRIYSLTERTA